MKNTKLVIAGAYYYDRKADIILKPHYSGEFSIVDCDSFEQMSELEDKYDKSYIENVKDNKIEFEGRDYFSTEYSPFCIDDDWELISDLSSLIFNDEDF